MRISMLKSILCLLKYFFDQLKKTFVLMVVVLTTRLWFVVQFFFGYRFTSCKTAKNVK